MKLNVLRTVHFLSLMVMISFFFVTVLTQYHRTITYYPFVLIWVFTAIKIDNTWLIRARNPIAFLILLMVLSLLLALTSGYTYEFSRFVYYTFMTCMWQFVYVFYKKNFEMISNKLWLIVMMIIIGAGYTYVGLQQYPDASRMLASGSSIYGEEAYNTFQQMGIGGYGFIYGMVLVTPVMYVYVRRNGFKRSTILYLSCFLLCFITIFKSSYAFALILTLAMTIIVNIYIKQSSRSIKMSILLITGMILAFIFSVEILTFINDVAQRYGIDMISKRMNEFIYVLSTNDISIIERFQLYKSGILNFLDRPLWGTSAAYSMGRNSGHSEIIDYLERYGIFGVVYVIFLVNSFKYTYRSMISYESRKEILIIQIATILLAAFNLVNIAYPVGVAVFFLNPLLLMKCDKMAIVKKEMSQRTNHRLASYSGNH